MVSSMIYTLTLNPAIDRTIYVDRINEEDVTRVKKTLRDAAGKGINVSKVLSQLDELSVCLGYVAGENGRFIKNSLEKACIDNTLITVRGETRENIKLISIQENRILEINEQGPNITKDNLASLYNILDVYLEAGDFLVISGSVPKGLSKTIYKDIIHKYASATIVLDVAGELFKNSIEAKPAIIKPNLYELGLYAGRKIENKEEALEVCVELLEKGIQKIFLSLGKDGAMYVTKDQVLVAKVPKLEAKSTVGAGDSFLAGMVKALNSNQSPEDTLRYACAVGSASVLSEGTASIKINDVEELFKSIEIGKF